jgi:DegV family protein with EDD domain
LEDWLNGVRIVADGGCDLSPALAAQYQITIVPVFVRFGLNMVSSDNMTSDDFWALAEKTSEIPGTASPAPGTFQSVFQQLISAGYDVVCLTLPGRYSGTFNAAWLAAQEFGDKVRVVDTGSLSLGMGLQVLAAAKEARAGSSAEDIQRMVEGLRVRTSVIFMLDTLEWVRRGGRLDRLMPLFERVARSLNVKPVIEMCNGEFRLIGISRSHKNGLQRIEDEIHARLPVETVAAAYTRGRDMAIALVAYLAGVMSLAPAEILVAEAGPAFAAHAGPNAVGAAVIRS